MAGQSERYFSSAEEVLWSALMTESELKQLQEEAWIGDAVLEIYVRTWILKTYGRQEPGVKSRFSSNAFLNCLGHPMVVEAQIGVIYTQQGLDAAFAWIKEKIEPVFVRQEENWQKDAGGRRTRKEKQIKLRQKRW